MPPYDVVAIAGLVPASHLATPAESESTFTSHSHDPLLQFAHQPIASGTWAWLQVPTHVNKLVCLQLPQPLKVSSLDTTSLEHIIKHLIWNSDFTIWIGTFCRIAAAVIDFYRYIPL
jgi:hypothetical protein